MLNRNYKLLSKYLLLIAVALMANEVLAKDKKQAPNVIIIMTDDQGYGDLACLGNPVIKTPNLDKLYNESARFTDFHVNPFCSPTRAALMTGRMSDRTHVRSTVYARNHLNLEETTMAEYFKASGYATGQFGKWHLGHNYPYRPMDRGFDYWVGHGDGGTGSASDYWGNDKMNDTYIRNGVEEEFEGFGTDVFFDEAMGFIKKNKKNPFFIYLATNVPHRPWNVKEEWYEDYKDVDASEYKDWLATRDFLATVTHFDYNLGRLRSFLSDNKLNENTILIFLTDNGTSGGSGVFNAGMKGKKGSMYEGGHRVPLFIHWPQGGFDKGEDIHEFTAHIDLLPTLKKICALNAPDKTLLPFDGKDLTKLLNKEQDNLPDRHLIMHQQNTREVPVKHMNSLVATSQWRLINGKELYKIKEDAGQKQNVASEYPDVVTQLNDVYDKHWDKLSMEQYPFPLAIVGSGYDQETVLVPDGWIRDNNTNTWDQSHINAGVNGSGFWPVQIAKPGKYQIDVRRWPKELDVSINTEKLEKKEADIYRRGQLVLDYGYGKSLVKEQVEEYKPVVKVKLQIGDKVVEKAINNRDKYARFNLNLEPGEKNVRAWLIDENNNKRGAYYVYLQKAD